MKNQIIPNDSFFQNTTSLNSWKRLTEGDERADKFESLLRLMLVASLFCALLICALRLSPAVDQSDDFRVSIPTVSVPQVIEKAPAAAVHAAVQAF